MHSLYCVSTLPKWPHDHSHTTFVRPASNNWAIPKSLLYLIASLPRLR
jgi:hypothetical protein